MQDLRQHIVVLKKHGYPEDEALILLMRLQLIKIIKAEISRRKWGQREAAKILGVAQPRIAEISALATEKFSVEILIKFLHQLGLRASLAVKPGKHYVPAKRQRQNKSSGRMKGGGKDDRGPESMAEETVCARRMKEQ
jgi:predicted XRE-type DNA-binding protein